MSNRYKRERVRFHTSVHVLRQVLLPAVHHITWTVAAEALAGAALLDLLRQRAHCGMPAVQSCLQRLLWHCHCVLYKQLSSWCGCCQHRKELVDASNQLRYDASWWTLCNVEKMASIHPFERHCMKTSGQC